MKRILVSALLLSAMVGGPLLAQPAPAPAGRGPAGGRGPQMPAVKGPAGPDAAVVIPPEKNIPLAQALDAVQTAVDACLKAQRPSAAVAMIVDLNGNIRVQL